MDLNRYPFNREVLSGQESLLTELIAAAINRACQSLEALVQVELKLGEIHLLPVSISRLSAQFGIEDADLVQVSQRFDCSADGGSVNRLRLLLPAGSATRMIRKLLREPDRAVEMTELEQESLIETGNILLNACLISLMERFDIRGCQQLTQLTFRKFNMLFHVQSPSLIESVSHAYSVCWEIDDEQFEMLLLIETGSDYEDLTII